MPVSVYGHYAIFICGVCDIKQVIRPAAGVSRKESAAMAKQRIMLKSKIHRATVTDADLHYVGSITIDEDLMKVADLLPYEKVMVVDIDNGSRLETYVIEGRSGSGTIAMNGAAARLIHKGDKVIIFSFNVVDEEEARLFKPVVVYMDELNRISHVEDHVIADDIC
jgi:aspartate 1-decarboxylase